MAGEIRAAGGAAIAVQADVGERADADRLVAETDAATAFLASDYAAYITGQARRVNGGMSNGRLGDGPRALRRNDRRHQAGQGVLWL